MQIIVMHTSIVVAGPVPRLLAASRKCRAKGDQFAAAVRLSISTSCTPLLCSLIFARIVHLTLLFTFTRTSSRHH